MKILLLIIGFVYGIVYMLVIHRMLKKTFWYKWIIGSLRFPYLYYAMKKELKLYNKKQLYNLINEIETTDSWNKNTWFGRVYKKTLVNYIYGL